MSSGSLIILMLVLLWGKLSVTRSLAPIGALIAFSSLFAAQFLLIEQELMGISFRVFAFIGVSIYLVFYSLRRQNYYKFAADARITIGIWLIYAFIAGFVSAINGSLVDSRDFADLVSRYGYALLLFVTAYMVARRAGGAKQIAVLLMSVAVANLAFAVAQNLGIEWAYDFQRQLYPETNARALELIEQGLITSFGYAPGLSPYSITTGYVLVCFGTFSICYGTHNGVCGQGRKVMIGFAMFFCISVLGGALILSRSTMVAGMMAALIILYGIARRGTRDRSGTGIAIAGVVLGGLVLAGVAVALNEIRGSERLYFLSDHIRVALWERAVEFIWNNLLFGGYEKAVHEGALVVAGHNFIINAFLYFGLVGFVAVLVVIGWVVYLSCKGVRARMSDANGLTVLASGAGVFAYLLKSLFHNESIVTSGIMLMLLVGVLLGSCEEIGVRRSNYLSRFWHKDTPTG